MWRMKMDNEILTVEEVNQLNKYLTGSPDKLSENDAVSNDKNKDTTSNPVNLLSYQEWREIIRSHFPGLLLAAEVGASLFGQLLIKDITNPCALVFIDVPSAGKTITLNLFSDLEQSLSLDNFTPASFVSQAASVSAEKLKEVDLLPKIKDKVLIIRDLAPLFGLRDDDLLKNMGILTRVLDGEGLELHAGVHGRRGYSGDYSFMLLAASTPISPKVFKLMGNLGSRLFFFNLRSEKKTEKVLAEQLVSTSWKDKQRICKKATKGFIAYLESKYSVGLDWDKSKDPEDCRLIISRCAALLSRLRGSINVWKEDFGPDEYSYQEPIIEMPDRITQILYNLARGHALICGRTNINYEDLGIILNITFDSAPLSRSRLFRILIENGGEITSDEVISRINCSRPTALKEIETLRILGIVGVEDSEFGMVGRPVKVATLKDEFVWFKEEESKLILAVSEELFGEGQNDEPPF